MSLYHKIELFPDEYQGYTPHSIESPIAGKITERKRPKTFKIESDSPEPLLKTTFYYNICKGSTYPSKLDGHKYERPATAMKRRQESKELKDAMTQRNRPQSAPPTAARPSSPYTTTYTSNFSENGSKVMEDSSVLYNLTSEPSIYSNKYQFQRSLSRVDLKTDRNNFLSSHKTDFGIKGSNPRNRTKSTNSYTSIYEQNNNIKHKPTVDFEEADFVKEFDKKNEENATLTKKEAVPDTVPPLRVMSTTRDISKGSVLGTSHISGYKGHTPSALRNIQKMKDEILDHQKMHQKDALRYQYDMHIRGYAGHIPQAVSNDRGDVFYINVPKTGASTTMDSFGPKENILKLKQENNRRAFVQSQFYTQTTPSPDAKAAAQNYFQNFRPLAGRYK